MSTPILSDVSEIEEISLHSSSLLISSPTVADFVIPVISTMVGDTSNIAASACNELQNDILYENYTVRINSISADLHEGPQILDISTPNISNCSLEEGCMENICALNPLAEPFIVHHNEMHSSPNSNYMESASDIEDSAYSILKKLRVKNLDKIIVGHININSIRNKINLFADLIQNKIDIIVISW